jgi:hypothetical protein
MITIGARQDAIRDWRSSPSTRATYRPKNMNEANTEIVQGWIERWVRNAAVNYPIIRESDSVGLLRDAAKDLPVVVVGIGPSLDRDIDRVKELKPLAYIIATDAALRPLLAHNVTPDLVLNFDCRDAQRTMWETVESLTADTVLVANSCTSPKTIEAWAGRMIFFNMVQADDEFCSNVLPILYPHIGGLPNLGTVGNGAVYLADFMGASKIFLLGFDFCYSERPDGGPDRYRCADYIRVSPSIEYPNGRWERQENAALYNNDERLKGVVEETINGRRYYTDETLTNYRRILIDMIGHLDFPIVDLSGASLASSLESWTFDRLTMDLFAPIAKGAGIIRHLPKILNDVRSQWTLDEFGLWHRSC